MLWCILLLWRRKRHGIHTRIFCSCMLLISYFDKISLWLPFSDFKTGVLKYLRVFPSQFHPNAWGILFLHLRGYVFDITSSYPLMYFIIFSLPGIARNPSVIHAFLWKVVKIWQSLRLMKNHAKFLRKCISSWDLLKIVGTTSLLLIKVRVVINLSLTLSFIGPPLIIISWLILMGNKRKSCLQKSSLLRIPLSNWLMRKEMQSLVNCFYKPLMKIGSQF